jgi:hypothetical protein
MAVAGFADDVEDGNRTAELERDTATDDVQLLQGCNSHRQLGKHAARIVECALDLLDEVVR